MTMKLIYAMVFSLTIANFFEKYQVGETPKDY